MQFLQDRAKSERGLPLMGTQDWNDAFDRTGMGGKGESVWLDMGLCLGLQLLEELAGLIGDENDRPGMPRTVCGHESTDQPIRLGGRSVCLRVQRQGEPIGSPVNVEGNCQLNSQTWAVLAGIPDEEQAGRCCGISTRRWPLRMDRRCLLPRIRSIIPISGALRLCPGTKENAAIFIHGRRIQNHDGLCHRSREEGLSHHAAFAPERAGQGYRSVQNRTLRVPRYVIGPGNPRYGEGAFPG